MPSRLAQLATRRCALVAESQGLRTQLAGAAGALTHALAPAQIGRAVLLGVGRHPLLSVSVAVALVAIGPRRLWKLATLGGAVVFARRRAPVVSAAVKLTRAHRKGLVRS